MRRRLSVLVIAIAAITVPGPQEAASASCVGPMLHVGDAHRPVVVRGARMIVEGKFFMDGCDDVVAVETTGCTAHTEQRDPASPMKDVTLSIRQAGHVWTLGTADAGTAKNDSLGQVTWAVVLPTALKAGRATLVADQAQGLTVVVRR
ncbi:MAG TPA: hypothetical protein VFE07_02230 [Marmoricola sp.]|nr:hypothetical protein [Marmoricola sp.]